MPKDEDTPVPFGVKRSHSKRISVLEEGQRELVEGQGKLAGDIGNVSKRVDALESRNSDRPSNAQLSISPTGARAKFQNISSKVLVRVIVSIVVVIALMLILIALIVGK